MLVRARLGAPVFIMLPAQGAVEESFFKKIEKTSLLF